MFSPAGLERIVNRAGWSIVEHVSVGDVAASDPSSLEHDERMLLLLRSDETSRAPAGATRAAAVDATDTATVQPDAVGAAYEERTKQLHEARGALAEAVSSLTGELNHARSERDQAAEEIRGLREHVGALDAEIVKQRQALEVLHEQLAVIRNMKVVRWTAWPRRLVYHLRARRG
jgi:hypothetical protein